MDEQTYAYQMGYDCGKHSVTEENCHFRIFDLHRNTQEWERGKRDAEKNEAAAAHPGERFGREDPK